MLSSDRHIPYYLFDFCGLSATGRQRGGDRSNDSGFSLLLTSVSSVRSRDSTRTVRTRDRRRVAVLQRRRGARCRRNSATCSATSGSPRARSTRCATCRSRRSTCSSRASPTRRRSSGSHPQSSTRPLAFYTCEFCCRLELANLL